MSLRERPAANLLPPVTESVGEVELGSVLARVIRSSWHLALSVLIEVSLQSLLAYGQKQKHGSITRAYSRL